MDPKIQKVLEDAGVRLDARETAVFARQLESFKSQTFDVKYPAAMVRKIVPMSEQADAAADYVTYRQFDAYGMAKVVHAFASDLPMVSMAGKEFTVPVKSLGAAYEMTIQDIRKAAKGVPLSTGLRRVAQKAIEASIDQVGAYGIPEAGVMGLLNHPNIPIVAPDTGSWTGATSQAAILGDVNKAVNYIVNLTKTIHKPTAVFFPPSKFQYLTAPAGANLDDNLANVLLRTNPYIQVVDQWAFLENASASGGARILVVTQDTETMNLEVPVEFEELPMQPKNLAMVTPVHARTAGVSVRYPLAFAYMDGI
jgi:hypothetical protein